MSDMTLWGFDGSTYVRTVKMVLAENGATDFKQVPLNVLKGDPKTPEHLERHPFGKVPVLDHDGMRILETTAIARYLNDVLPGKSLIPSTPKDRARMDMVIGAHRLVRLRRPDRRRRRLSSVSGFRRRQERGDAKGRPRERPQDDRTRHEDEGLFPVHRRRPEPRRPLSRADRFLRFADAGQGRAFRRPRLCGLVDEDRKPCRVSKPPNPISADDAMLHHLVERDWQVAHALACGVEHERWRPRRRRP